MPEDPLPLYHIRDFNQPFRQEHHFYLKALDTHLKQHAFTQKPHGHDFYLVLFILQGTGRHTIDFISYPVKPNQVFFLRPGQVHAWELSADTAGYILFFSPEFYLFGHSEKKLESFPFFQSLQPGPLLEITAKEMTGLRDLAAEMETESNGPPGWKHDDLLRALLDVLLIRLARLFYREQPARKPVTSTNTLRQFEALVNENYKKHLPVTFYAEKLNVTVKQLNDLVKHSLGKTITELIQDRVVLEARRLLVHSDLSISQIGAALGYFDNSYFSRFFKKQTGQTPEQFRQTSG